MVCSCAKRVRIIVDESWLLKIERRDENRFAYEKGKRTCDSCDEIVTDITSPSHNDAMSSFHTANVELGGSESNPIDVDLIRDHQG